jgi:hypothetical protein
MSWFRANNSLLIFAIRRKLGNMHIQIHACLNGRNSHIHLFEADAKGVSSSIFFKKNGGEASLHVTKHLVTGVPTVGTDACMVGGLVLTITPPVLLYPLYLIILTSKC